MLRRSKMFATLAAFALVLPVGLTALPAQAEPDIRTVTLVGSLQSELGCSGDWQPDCEATDLVKDADGFTYSASFQLPAGAYEYKVAVDHAWDESYGPDGSGNNGPLALQGSAKVTVVYDDETHTT
ncbi:MAG: hypothetical protein H0T91_12610, partial [Propionibacteriaceae bacterium]|nr:hypothetical protein [Propionibacteriaceae bacterium]